MPEAVVSQVHRLARRAKAAKKLTFTNSDNEDLDILYVDLEPDEDDVELEQDGVQPTGTNGNDEEDDPQDDPHYEPNHNSDNDDSDDNNGDEGGHGRIYTKILAPAQQGREMQSPEIPHVSEEKESREDKRQRMSQTNGHNDSIPAIPRHPLQRRHLLPQCLPA